MKLLDLDPQWLLKDGKRVGFTFVSPVQHEHPTRKTKWRQSCFPKPTSTDDQFKAIGDAPVQLCNPSCGWTIAGGIDAATFETMTVTPSIDGSAGGLWHGFITNGEIK